jgi:hypothetical protein
MGRAEDEVRAGRCPGCGRYVGLHDRTGARVGTEFHGHRAVESAELVGEGPSGLGMWRVRREWTCGHGRGLPA